MTKMTISPPMRKGEHNVDNFMRCSFAYPARSPLLQGFLREEELCKVADVIISLSGVSSGLSPELSFVAFGCKFSDDAHCRAATEVCCRLLQRLVASSPIKDGLQQCGEGCDGRLVQVLR